jgi:threonylcarbamoyladenosine tRNA methylthiotransferase CDKAL1
LKKNAATDIICGFPGETEEDFEETMDLVRKYRFPVVNISQFYARPGTPAARFKQLSSQIVKDRSRRLSEFFNSGISSPYQKLQGSKQRVFVTEMAADKHNLCGHNKSYVQVILPPTEAKMGTDVECTISDATGRFYCRGVIVKRKQSFGWIPVALLVLLVAIAAAMKCFMV